ncbi:MAG: hypothetical protein ACREKL_14030, partial [Chthoniobacterales bacterium]
MKIPSLPRIWALVAILILPLLQDLHAADVTDDLETFRKKVAAEESKQSPDSRGEGRQISMQLKVLQNLIARADYDRAQQMLETLGNYGLSPQFQDEWMPLSEAIGKELDKRKDESLRKWNAEVDELMKEAKKGCLEAKTSADLDALLLRCAALQMRREQQNTVAGERTTRKLAGAATTLSAFADYLDFRDAGNIKNANEALRRLLSSDSNLPVLTAADIEGRLLTDDPAGLSVDAALAKIFDGVKSPDDLAAALEKMKKYSISPATPQLASLSYEQPRLQSAMLAWKAAKDGDVNSALAALNRIPSSGGSESGRSYYAPISAQILTYILQQNVQKWTKLSFNSGETPASYLKRILEELQARGDYVSMIEVLRFSEQMARAFPSGSISGDRAALEAFVAAQRFENAGDNI